MTTLIDKTRSAAGGTPEPDATTVDQLLSCIAALAPLVAEHTRQIEQDRRLPTDLVTALKSARIYSVLVPRRYGGLELDVPSTLRATSALAKLDGSVGWNAMIGQVGSLLPFLTTPTLCERIFGDGKDHILAGSGQPAGRAERTPGGWKVTGSWPFASGCQNAEWIMGNCVMMEDGSPIPASDASGPMIRACLMPAGHWDIHDTWHTFGLRGTGSHDVELRDVFVPDSNFFEFPFGSSFAPDPIFGKVFEVALLLHGAFSVGVAEGAIADLVALAASGLKQQRMTVPLAETDRFKESLARLDTELRATRALLAAEADRIWCDRERAAAKSMNDLAGLQGVAAWITSACVHVVEGCFELAGSRAVYETSSLQRRMLDLRVGATHAAVHPRNYVSAGAAAASRIENARE
ncbi:MAG TPA: acyl-CoA dehydrogenase family protein [Rhodopila sp.]|uniref:acyl-CoA dehydrogenase family protein n=1 Tax=Rhodopila sp. TaxID=2480087 RepID=UPI002C4802C9|nr:acyl-CoA dehydrogenase family protein [Rhodopila sp.]HVY15243.1 acyl-CoA dehydrogenase family protein [Rhodopila sp.]